jgi:hypothetical protein
MKKIKIYRTGWELYQGRGVWETYYTDWTTDEKVADKQFLELSEFYKDYPVGLHRVLKVESSVLSIDLRVNEAVADMIKDDVHKRHFNDSYFRFTAGIFAELDSHLKTCFPCQDDMDTCQGTPNFPKGKYAVNVGKKEYMGYIYDEFIKVPEDGYYTYDFALVNNAKVIAIGNEHGRCGGVTYSCRDNNFVDKLKQAPVYDKVKHLPVATSEELEEPIYKYFNSHDEYEKYMAKTSKGDGNK